MEDIPKEVVPPEYGGTGPSIPELTGKLKSIILTFLFKQDISLLWL